MKFRSNLHFIENYRETVRTFSMFVTIIDICITDISVINNSVINNIILYFVLL